MFYVSPTGNDDNHGMTPDAPKATLKAAVNLCRDGYSVRLASGEHVINEQVKALASIDIAGVGATRDDVVLRCVSGPADSPLSFASNGSSLRNLTILGRKGANNGGCMSLYNVPASFMASNCVFKGGSSSNRGGGVFGGTTQGGAVQKIVYDSVFADCEVYGTSDKSDGGAVAGMTLYRCVLLNNKATTGGAASLCNLYDCLVVSNQCTSAEMNHGGSAVVNSRLYNCTVADNRSLSPGGVAIGGASTFENRVYNSIVWGNTAPESVADDALDIVANFCTTDEDDAFVISNTCTYPDASVLGTASIGNMTSDPKLRNYRPSAYSPCINAANTETTFFPNSHLRSTDLAGAVRVYGSAPDLGCFERVLPLGMVVIIR